MNYYKILIEYKRSKYLCGLGILHDVFLLDGANRFLFIEKYDF